MVLGAAKKMEAAVVMSAVHALNKTACWITIYFLEGGSHPLDPGLLKGSFWLSTRQLALPTNQKLEVCNICRYTLSHIITSNK
jgi:hypothetical protein